jgi:hypothetical protein
VYQARSISVRTITPVIALLAAPQTADGMPEYPRAKTMHLFALALTLSLTASAVASAQTEMPDSESGRYSSNPVADGVLRLDTRTGSLISHCEEGDGEGIASHPVVRSQRHQVMGFASSGLEPLRLVAPVVAGTGPPVRVSVSPARPSPPLRDPGRGIVAHSPPADLADTVCSSGVMSCQRLSLSATLVSPSLLSGAP